MSRPTCWSDTKVTFVQPQILTNQRLHTCVSEYAVEVRIWLLFWMDPIYRDPKISITSRICQLIHCWIVVALWLYRIHLRALSMK